MEISAFEVIKMLPISYQCSILLKCFIQLGARSIQIISYFSLKLKKKKRPKTLYMAYHQVCNKFNSTGEIVQQNLITLQEYMRSGEALSVIRVVQSFVFCFCVSLFVFFHLSFGHCIVFFPSFTYGF